MSADLQSALIDIALWLYRGFFWPGDQLLSKFSTIEDAARGGMLSGVISAVAWLGAIVLLVMVYRFIRHLDRTLTAFVLRLHDEAQRALRVVARRLTIAFRSYAVARQARLTRTEVSELPALTGLQLEVLQSHAALPPAHLLTPSEVASDLGMRSADIEKVLGTLRKLSLVERTLGAGDGEDGYRLTRAGEVFLAACSSRAPPVRATALPQHSLRAKRIEPTLGST
jgi:DNA-binding MarR family transcriptional regulator